MSRRRAAAVATLAMLAATSPVATLSAVPGQAAVARTGTHAGTSALAGTPALAETFQAHATGGWTDGSLHGSWRAVYDGYGTTAVRGSAQRYLTLSPKPPQRSSGTHAGLVTTAATFGDLDLTTRSWTVRQLREGRANTWEVAWTLWNYTDDDHFYSVVLKPNGWELGKEDPAYPGSQRYLRTGSTPTFQVGSRHTVRVRQVGNQITVWAGGRRLTSFTDRERAYRGGRVGLYSEDAYVRFDDIVVRRP